MRLAFYFVVTAIVLCFMWQICSAQTPMGSATVGKVDKGNIKYSFLDVEIKAALAKDQKPNVGVFTNNVQIANLENLINDSGETLSVITAETNPTRFKIKLPSSVNLSQKLQLIVSNFQSTTKEIMGIVVDIAPQVPTTSQVPLKPQLINDLIAEPNSLSIQVRPENPDAATLGNLKSFWVWLEQQQANPENVAEIFIEAISQPIDVKYSVKKITLSKNSTDVVNDGGGVITLELDKQLPVGKFNAKVTFPAKVPVKLESGNEVKGKDLAGIKTPDRFFASESSAIKEVSMRGFERNLDLGVTFTNGPSPKGVSRVSRGVLDLRFAPWLNVLATRPERGKWLSYLTPFTLNANIATGKIKRGTLALNQIVFGTEFEFRRYDFGSNSNDETNPKKEFRDLSFSEKKSFLRHHVPTYHRIIISALNKSDRDFKQADFLITGEYKPVFGILNYPIQVDALPRVRESKIFTDPPQLLAIPSGKIGYSFIPVVGFEVGRTYFRDNPAKAVKPSKTARRFYTGATFKLDITPFLTVSVEDKFYIRGEVKKDRQENYFKATVDFFITGASFSNIGQSLFFAYEFGKQPPFATPETNVLKVGYRLRADGWFNRIR